MRRFTSPRWVVSHVAVSAVVVAFVGLGFWQLDRLDQRRELNDRLTSRSNLEPIDVRDIVGTDPDDVEYRRVTATGVWRAAETVLVGNQTLDGLPGDWVLTPLELDDGTVVGVSRGFVPRSALADTDAYAPPAGEVTVDGIVFDSASGGRVATGSDIPHPELSRVDTGAWGQLIGIDLGGIYVQAFVSEAEVPRFQVPLPELGEGPHLSYAIQWYLFATMGAVAYALVLRRIARGDTRRGDVAVPWDI